MDAKQQRFKKRIMFDDVTSNKTDENVHGRKKSVLVNNDHNHNHKDKETQKEDTVNKPNNKTANKKLQSLNLLKQVIGHQSPHKKVSQEKKGNKRVKCDIEAESAEKLQTKEDAPKEVKIRKKDRTGKKEKKETQVKNMNKVEDNTAPAIRISKEKFYEVTSDLKSAFESSPGQFSLSQKFDEKIECLDQADAIRNSENYKKFNAPPPVKQISKVGVVKKRSRLDVVKRKMKFFISEDDPCVKEGVENFMRTKPLDILTKEWDQNRADIVALLKYRSIERKNTKKKINGNFSSH